jgi:hypothetical protein
MKFPNTMIVRIGVSLFVSSILLVSHGEAGGPAYSRFGIGDLSFFAGSRSYAMGGVGAGLYGDGFINRLNPAGLAGITRTRFSGTFEFSDYASSDASGSARYASGGFGGMSIAIPVSHDYGVVLVGELTPYSSVQYAIGRSDTQLGISSEQQYFGSGGISRFDFGSSVALTDELQLGAKINYLAGSILQTSNITFADNSYSNTVLTHSNHYSGVSFTVGATYEGLSSLLNSP